ncbi:MAG: hypothetical protein JWO46_1148 [Nocardioidaceae bacterium]|nr:hypothetical protein [Nocardioidaceae bacterium]
MIGWYVHHHGSGHAHRATAVAQVLGEPVTGLSSLPAPDGWPGRWVRLDRDDDERTVQVDAGGALHWVPVHHTGLRSRMAAVSRWIAEEEPDLLVVDVSVEVALLARLHGVPVVSVAMPGERSDRAHTLGYDVSSAVVAAWPREAGALCRGLDEDDPRVHHVGAISRFPVAEPTPPVQASVVVLLGAGGDDLTGPRLDHARTATPDWTWTVLGGRAGTWVRDPWPTLLAASVVVTHAGQNAVAEVAASRRPAVVVPQARPFGEQLATARALRDPRWPAVVLEPGSTPDWGDLLGRAARLDGAGWEDWCDGGAAERTAGLLRTMSRSPAR